jgi:hypothetical protein
MTKNCQIFLGTANQNMAIKYTGLLPNITNGHENSYIFHSKAFHNIAKLRFWYANVHYLATPKNGSGIVARVARWYIFKPKIHIWVNFCNESYW